MRKKARFSAIQSASICARPHDSSHQVPVPARTSDLLIADEISLRFTGLHRRSSFDGLGTFPADFRPSRQNFQNLVYLHGRTVLSRAPIADCARHTAKYDCKLGQARSDGAAALPTQGVRVSAGQATRQRYSLRRNDARKNRAQYVAISSSIAYHTESIGVSML
jgi:hypothetical protein